jgi:F-type H+-transporting ATPase subunit b
MNITLTIVGQALAFAIFVWFTARFVWPPLVAAIETRQKTIADGLAAAERGKSDLELAKTRSAEVLREAKQQATEVIAQGEKRRDELIDEAKAAAKAEGDRIIAAAKAEIEQEVSRARESLRQQVADLSIVAAEKILRREVNPQVHADLLSAIKQQL